MKKLNDKFSNISDSLINKWQEIANLLANIIGIPAALIMKTENEYMEVFISSKTEDNPYKAGDRREWYGLYCETVIKSQKKLFIQNALKNKNWNNNPDIKLGMIAYLGYPINFPDSTPFGTICILDNKENKFSKTYEQLVLTFRDIIENDLLQLDAIQAKTIEFDNILREKNKLLTIAKDRAKKNKLKYKFLSSVSFEGIIIHDKDGDIDVNRSFKKLLGYSKKDLSGKKLIELLVSEKFKRIAYENFNKNYAPPYDLELVKKDGSVIPVEVESRNTKTASGQIVRVTAIRDISRRKESEKKLATLSTAVMQSSISIVITGAKGNIKYVNPAFTKISGYTAQEAIGQNPRILNAGLLPKEIYVEMWNTIIKGNIWKGELCNKTKHNKIFWERVIITPILGDDKKIVNYLAIKEDITAQKKQYKITEREKLFNENLIDSLPGIFFLYEYINNEARLIKWNKNHEELLGYTTEDLQNMAAIDLFPQNDLKILTREIEKLVRGNEINVELNVKHKRGYVIPYLFNALSFKDNETLFFTGIGIDISKGKKTEQELVRAKEKAEESDRLKSAFLASMSHEIRTPLNSIIGFSNIIAESSDNPQLKGFSNIINKQNDLLLQLVNDILDFSKFEAGIIETTHQKFSINNIVEDVLNTFKLECPSNIELIPKKLADSLIITSDEVRLMQVFTNLISNAFKFTENGKITFGFDLDEHLEIRGFVKDTGKGIPKDKQSIIFERFTKLDKFTQGTGLGLAIVRFIIETMGGKIWIESEPGKGSCFYFKIPFKIDVPNNLKKKSKLQSDMSENISSGATILIAEDNESNFLYLKELLGRYELNILYAADGKKTVEMCKANTDIALVLMDIKMPLLNGYEATKQLKKIFPQLPVIAQTAYASNNDRIKAKEVGCDDYISKPIRREVLYEILEKYL